MTNLHLPESGKDVLLDKLKAENKELKADKQALNIILESLQLSGCMLLDEIKGIRGLIETEPTWVEKTFAVDVALLLDGDPYEFGEKLRLDAHDKASNV
jgi:hypothetical protein